MKALLIGLVMYLMVNIVFSRNVLGNLHAQLATAFPGIAFNGFPNQITTHSQQHTEECRQAISIAWNLESNIIILVVVDLERGIAFISSAASMFPNRLVGPT